MCIRDRWILSGPLRIAARLLPQPHFGLDVYKRQMVRRLTVNGYFLAISNRRGIVPFSVKRRCEGRICAIMSDTRKALGYLRSKDVYKRQSLLCVVASIMGRDVSAEGGLVSQNADYAPVSAVSNRGKSIVHGKEGANEGSHQNVRGGSSR